MTSESGTWSGARPRLWPRPKLSFRRSLQVGLQGKGQPAVPAVVTSDGPWGWPEDSDLTQKQRRSLRIIHAELVRYLAEQMTPVMVKELKDNLLTQKVISPIVHTELRGVHEIVDCLLRRNQIVIGKKDGYKLLIETLKYVDQYRLHGLAETVERCQNELWKICNDDSATSEQPATELSRDSPEASDRVISRDLLTKLDSKDEDIKRLQKEKEELEGEVISLKTQMMTQSEEFKAELQKAKEENENLKKLSIDRNALKDMKSTPSEIQHEIKVEKNKDDTEKAGQAANENISQMEREAGNQQEVQTLSKQLDETKKEIEQFRRLLNENMSILIKMKQENIPPYVQILYSGREKEIEELDKEVQKMLEEKQRRTYAKIVHCIDNEMNEEKCTAMKHHLLVSGHITTKEFDTLKGWYDISECLQSKDIINIGKESGYDELMKILRDKDHHALANKVEEFQKKLWKDVKDSSSWDTKSLTTEHTGADETLEPQEAVDKDGSDSQLGDEGQTGLCSNFVDGTVADAQEEH